jgi:alpha-glucoside transport system substrate-binding protein
LTGIDVQWEGSAEFETITVVRVEGGDALNVAGLPQPVLLVEFVKDGSIPDHAEMIDPAFLEENFSQGWIYFAIIDGQLSAVSYRARTRSIVRFPVEAFAEAGNEIPET